MNNENDRPGKVSLQMIILRVLFVLTVFILGGLVSMIVVNRLLVAQLAIYGDSYMAASSAIIDFMDDILPYLAASMVGFSIMTFATISVWLWTKVELRYRRYGVALLALVFVMLVVWLYSGQSTLHTPEFMMTPTPIP